MRRNADGAAYVDTSAIVAIALAEPGWPRLASKLESYERLFSSGLLEAELKAVIRREQLSADPLRPLPRIQWVLPNRALSPEIDRVLDAGYLRGADAFHLACALYLDPTAEELGFETLDARQRAVAKKLGFG